MLFHCQLLLHARLIKLVQDVAVEAQVLLPEVQEGLQDLVLSIHEQTRLLIIQVQKRLLAEQFAENYFQIARLIQSNDQPAQSQFSRRQRITVVGCVVELHEFDAEDVGGELLLNIDPPMNDLLWDYLRLLALLVTLPNLDLVARRMQFLQLPLSLLRTGIVVVKCLALLRLLKLDLIALIFQFKCLLLLFVACFFFLK